MGKVNTPLYLERKVSGRMRLGEEPLTPEMLRGLERMKGKHSERTQREKKRWHEGETMIENERHQDQGFDPESEE